MTLTKAIVTWQDYGMASEAISFTVTDGDHYKIVHICDRTMKPVAVIRIPLEEARALAKELTK